MKSTFFLFFYSYRFLLTPYLCKKILFYLKYKYVQCPICYEKLSINKMIKCKKHISNLCYLTICKQCDRRHNKIKFIPYIGDICDECIKIMTYNLLF